MALHFLMLLGGYTSCTFQDVLNQTIISTLQTKRIECKAFWFVQLFRSLTKLLYLFSCFWWVTD